MHIENITNIKTSENFPASLKTKKKRIFKLN